MLLGHEQTIWESKERISFFTFASLHVCVLKHFLVSASLSPLIYSCGALSCLEAWIQPNQTMTKSAGLITIVRRKNFSVEALKFILRPAAVRQQALSLLSVFLEIFVYN